jgi:hypothetical protein
MTYLDEVREMARVRGIDPDKVEEDLVNAGYVSGPMPRLSGLQAHR